MQALPIFLNYMFNEFVAVVLSVTFVLAFGEVNDPSYLPNCKENTSSKSGEYTVNDKDESCHFLFTVIYFEFLIIS